MFAPKPQLSVVIPAYNASPFIRECLNSVFEQTNCPDFEVIVVNDGSTDNTDEVLRQISVKQTRLRIISTVNGGPGSARNHGVDGALSEIIIFLDADDKMLPGRLEHQGVFMLENPNVTVSFGDIVVQNSNESSIEQWGFADTGSDDFQRIPNPLSRILADGCYVCNPASAVRRTDYLAVGKQDTSLHVAEDTDFWCRLAAKGGQFFLTKRKYSWLRREQHGNLMSSHYVYRDPVRVLANHLRLHRNSLSSEEKIKAQQLLDWRANMYLRYVWAYERSNLQTVSQQLSDVVTPEVIRYWLCVRFFPASIGRAFRWLKHRVVR